MEERDRAPDEAKSGADEGSALLRVALPVMALIIVTAALYLARDVIIPLAAALILSLVLSPISSRLERVVGRFFAAAIVVVVGVAIIGTTVYFTAVELTMVADEVAGYSYNIGSKLAAIEKSTPGWLRRVEAAVTEVKHRVQKPDTKASHPSPTPSITVSSGSFLGNWTHVTPVLQDAVELMLAIVLLFFLLYSRRDLRDRCVRLAARVRIPVASRAVETASHAVARYLLLLTLINLSFGVAIGLILWALGLPNPMFWGLLTFLLRYIPYVGALVSSLLPALVAFAVFPGWSKVLEVIGAFLALDLITTHVAEPFMIGSGIDMSPVALLVSTIYWSWLWGVPGLLLAIPLSACMKVAGEHIPELNVLALLLGGERTLKTHHDFYRMLLEFDPTAANALAIRYCEEHGLEQTFDAILAPALELAGNERSEQHISDDTAQFILDFVQDLIRDLAARFCEPRAATGVRVVGVCPPGEVHGFGLLMILALFRCAGTAVKFVGDDQSIEQACDRIRLFSPDIICLSCTLTECLPAAIELTRALRVRFPHVPIIAGGVAPVSYPADLLRAGCSEICATKTQMRRIIRQLTFIKRASGPAAQRAV